MNSFHGCRRMALAAAVVISVAGPAQSQQFASPPDPLEGFRVGFGLGYLHLAGCGKKPLGDLLRRLILDQVDTCPFAVTQKTEFHNWVDETASEVDVQLQQYVTIHGRLPQSVGGSTCQEADRNEEFQQWENQLERYGRGEIGVEAMVEKDKNVCNPGEGTP